ncbi:MAG: T9SS type A sorting domain-containing protein [Bacteroidales bacterium]|nr:T9SS type A sorting domain-containing protein [Bacteroidales bacterium]
MKTLFSIVLLLMSFPTFSQSLYQIADTTKKWSTLTYGYWIWNVIQCGGTSRHKFGEEVVINGTPYLSVYESQDSLQQNWYQVGFLREDTMSSKVWFTRGDPDEIGLIYDFNLQVGDTVNIDNYYVFEDALLVCQSIDSIIINGSVKKCIFLHAPDSYEFDVWIEGIGSRYGLLVGGFYNAPGGASSLLCCTKNDTLIFADTVFNTCYIDEFYPTITSEFFDTAYLNTAYEFQVQLGGISTVDSFALIGDVIPEGFDFDETTGLLTGIPASTGLLPCVITVMNYDIGNLTDILYSYIPVVLPAKIEEIPKQSEIEIYPNPCGTSFLISYTGNLIHNFNVGIYNCHGKLIDEFTMDCNAFRVDCSAYKNGVYFLKFTDLNNRIFKIEKLIKK